MANSPQHRDWISTMNRLAVSAALALAVVLVSAVVTTEVAQAQTLTTLYSFCAQSGCKDGDGPWSGLVQGTDGNFYGTTTGGGAIAVLATAQRTKAVQRGYSLRLRYLGRNNSRYQHDR